MSAHTFNSYLFIHDWSEQAELNHLTVANIKK